MDEEKDDDDERKWARTRTMTATGMTTKAAAAAAASGKATLGMVAITSVFKSTLDFLMLFYGWWGLGRSRKQNSPPNCGNQRETLMIPVYGKTRTQSSNERSVSQKCLLTRSFHKKYVLPINANDMAPVTNAHRKGQGLLWRP